MFDTRETTMDTAGEKLARPSDKGGRRVTVLAQGTTCVGSLHGEDTIHIDGYLEGELEGYLVVVGASGRVKGKIVGEAVYVDGEVDGEIIAAALTLTQAALVEGHLTVTGKMSVAEGARIDGTIEMNPGRPKNGKIGEGTPSSRGDAGAPRLRFKSAPAADRKLS